MKAWIRSGLVLAIVAWVWSRQQAQIGRLRAELAQMRDTANEYRKEAEAYRQFKEGTRKAARQYEALTAYRRRTHDDNPDAPSSKRS